MWQTPQTLPLSTGPSCLGGPMWTSASTCAVRRMVMPLSWSSLWVSGLLEIALKLALQYVPSIASVPSNSCVLLGQMLLLETGPASSRLSFVLRFRGVPAGKSYRYAVWLPVAAAEAKRPQAVRNFRARHASGDADTDWTDTNNINPQWYRVSLNNQGRFSSTGRACAGLTCPLQTASCAKPHRATVQSQQRVTAKGHPTGWPARP